MRPSLRAIVTVALLALTFPAAAAQDSARRTILIPWQQWLGESDRYELKWEVTVSPSRQTYDLRHLVLINIEVPESALAAVSAKPDLHLLIKAGDNERWFEPEDYAHIAPDQLGEKLTIQLLSALYLPPGHYRLGIILLDAATQRRNVAHHSITIPAERDSLARLDDRLPSVEFASVSRSEAPGKHWKVPGGRTGHVRISQTPVPINERSAITMLAHHPDPRSLPLRSQWPLEIDVLVNFTPTAARENNNLAYSISESDMWGILRVLALIKPRAGCVLMTGIDVLGQKMIFSRVDAATVNWEALADSVTSIDANTVELQTLEAHRRMSQFFRTQVSQLMENSSHCRQLANTAAERVYIIAADGVSFPAGTQRTAVEAVPGRTVRLYYFRRGNVWDEMERIVKPLHPHHLNADTPQKFRQSLERLTRDLGGLQN